MFFLFRFCVIILCRMSWKLIYGIAYLQRKYANTFGLLGLLFKKIINLTIFKIIIAITLFLNVNEIFIS